MWTQRRAFVSFLVQRCSLRMSLRGNSPAWILLGAILAGGGLVLILRTTHGSPAVGSEELSSDKGSQEEDQRAPQTNQISDKRSQQQQATNQPNQTRTPSPFPWEAKSSVTESMNAMVRRRRVDVPNHKLNQQQEDFVASMTFATTSLRTPSCPCCQ